MKKKQKNQKPKRIIIRQIDPKFTQPSEIQRLYSELKVEHATYLEEHGVKIPPLFKRQSAADKKAGKAPVYHGLGLQLVVHYAYVGNLIHSEAINAYIQAMIPGSSGDQQPRHLQYPPYGWDLRLNGKANNMWIDRHPVEHRCTGLASTQHPWKHFAKKMKKRRSVSSTGDWWHDLLRQYNHCCASCGEPGQLEKGHKDPNEPLTPDNTIPQCAGCNNYYSDDAILNDEGRIVAVNSYRFVKNVSDDVKRQIWVELKKEAKELGLNG